MELDLKAASILNSAGFRLWDIFSEETFSTLITYENNKVDQVVNGIDSGIGIRGMRDFNTFYAHTNNPHSLTGLASSIAGYNPLKDIKLNSVKPGFINKIEIDPFGVEFSEKMKLIKDVNSFIREKSPLVKQAAITYGEKKQKVRIINDTGADVSEDRVYTSFIIMVIAEKNGRIETCHEVVSGYSGFELFKKEDVFKKAGDAVDLALRLLNAEKKITGEMTAVLSSSAGGTMIHEACGHSFEADLVQKDMSEYKGMKGKKVASDILTVIDDAVIENKRGSFSFDDEGMPAQKTVLIEKGQLVNFMYDRETAAKDGVEPTGNGRRESFRFRPIPRMTNTMIAPGSGDPEGLIKDTKSGIFVKKMGGGQVNTVTGEFIFEVKDGYMIENGKVTSPLRDATLMGTGREVLNTIDAVCSDLGFGVGTCGKDGQGVPVADAQPTLRIPKILVGSK